MMKGYVTNIEELSLANENFRQVVYTAKRANNVWENTIQTE